MNDEATKGAFNLSCNSLKGAERDRGIVYECVYLVEKNIKVDTFAYVA